jgi:hypothetical protein
VNVRRLAVVLLVLGSCRQHRQAAPPPVVEQVVVPSLPAESPWVGTLAAAQAAADSGQFATADSILTAFEHSAPDSPDVSESAFWRAMLRADPRNPAFAPADARAALDAYLATPNPRRRTEATVMLRMLALSDSIRSLHTAQRSAAEARDRTREEEIQKLRDDLQRTQAELDRIKRRLGSPKP